MGNKALIVLGIVLAIVILLVLIVGGGAISTYNSLVTKQQNVNAKWSQVENQMQRRADLIPNIVATVKGVAGLEERVFTKIADARSQLLSDRKSTRLNSSHRTISYAVFCLKKKKNNTKKTQYIDVI